MLYDAMDSTRASYGGTTCREDEYYSTGQNDYATVERCDDGNYIIYFSRVPPITPRPTSIIVLTHVSLLQQITTVRACLESLLAHTHTPHEVIVVNNGSPLRQWHISLSSLAQSHPNLRIIKTNRNLGVAGGRNHAAANAKHDYLLFLDDDMIVRSDWLTFFWDCINKVPEAGAISMFAGSYDIDMAPQQHTVNWSYPHRYLGGGATLISKELFHRLGGFDAATFHPFGAEDVDLSWRILQFAKRPLVYCISNALEHIGHRTISHLPHWAETAARAYYALLKKWDSVASPSFSTIVTCHNPTPHILSTVKSAISIPLCKEVMLYCQNKETVDYVEEVVASNCDSPKLVILRDGKDLGGAVSRNKSIRYASSPYILFLTPGAHINANIEDAIETICMRKDIDILLPEVAKVDHIIENDGIRYPTHNELLGINLTGALMRKIVCAYYGWFNEALPVNSDTFFLNMLVLKGGRVAFSKIDGITEHQNSDLQQHIPQPYSQMTISLAERLFAGIGQRRITNDIRVATETIAITSGDHNLGPLYKVYIDNTGQADILLTANVDLQWLDPQAISELALLATLHKNIGAIYAPLIHKTASFEERCKALLVDKHDASIRPHLKLQKQSHVTQDILIATPYLAEYTQ